MAATLMFEDVGLRCANPTYKLDETLNRLKQLDWGVKVLPTLHDVDEPPDLQWLPQALVGARA